MYCSASADVVGIASGRSGTGHVIAERHAARRRRGKSGNRDGVLRPNLGIDVGHQGRIDRQQQCREVTRQAGARTHIRTRAIRAQAHFKPIGIVGHAGTDGRLAGIERKDITVAQRPVRHPQPVADNAGTARGAGEVDPDIGVVRAIERIERAWIRCSVRGRTLEPGIGSHGVTVVLDEPAVAPEQGDVVEVLGDRLGTGRSGETSEKNDRSGVKKNLVDARRTARCDAFRYTRYGQHG